MLTLLAGSVERKPQGKLKPKVFWLGSAMVASLLLYSKTTQQPKLVQLETSNQPAQYTAVVDRLADNYLVVAQQLTSTPGNNCYKRSLNDCLTLMKPEEVRSFESLPPQQAINSELKFLVFQVRVEALELAKERVSSSSRKLRLVQEKSHAG